MKTIYRQRAFTAIILCALALPACAFLEKNIASFSDMFKGNTRRDIVDYDLDERAQYRRYKYLKKVEEREKEKEILENLE